VAAPILLSAAAPTLSPISAGQPVIAGNTVAEVVVDGSITDPDGAALEAVVVESVDTSLGTWQFSLDDGLTWLTIASDLINPLDGYGLALGAAARIRLLPFGALEGDAGFVFRAWDQSDGASSGEYIRYTPGTGSVSAGSDQATLAVGPLVAGPSVNSVPMFAWPARNGQGITDFAGDTDQAYELAVQPDGKIVLVGRSQPVSAGGSDFAAARYNPDGSLDTAFSVDGRATISFGPGFNMAHSVALQADGKLLLAGSALAGVWGALALARLNPDGSPDTSFGVDGTVTLSVSAGSDFAEKVVVQADGKIVVAGYGNNNQFGSDADLLVTRFNADGSLDTTFSGDGTLTLSVTSGFDALFDVLVQPDGKILAVGGAGAGPQGDMVLVRLNADGTLDTAFATEGILISYRGIGTDAGESVALQPDGKILVAGYSQTAYDSEFTVWRYLEDGAPDNSFGVTGRLTIDFGGTGAFANSIRVQPDGKIVAAGFGYFGGDANLVLARFLSDGTPDTGFGAGGTVVTSFFPDGVDVAYSVALQPDGKIVVGGNVFNMLTFNYDFALVRYNADGSPDPSFEGPQPSTLGGSVALYGTAPVVLDSDVVVYDAELAALNAGAGNYAGSSVTLSRHGGADGSDVFSAIASGDLAALSEGADVALGGVSIGTVTRNSGGVLTLTFGANATQARLNETLQSIAYTNLSPTRPPNVQLDWQFSDGNTGSQGLGAAGQAMGHVFVTMNPSGANDTLYGTAGNDTMDGFAGADAMVGGAGDDLYLVDNVNDYAGESAGGGRDTVHVSLATAGTYQLAAQIEVGVVVSADTVAVHLVGNRLSNELMGNGAANHLIGGEGGDRLFGNAGNDTLEGGVGVDIADYRYALGSVEVNLFLGTAHGADGDDTLLMVESVRGSEHADRIAGDAQANSLLGGLGNDTIAGGAGADTLQGGDGKDTVDYSAAEGAVVASLADKTAIQDGWGATDVFTSIERLVGSDFGDRFAGDGRLNWLDGGNGNDTLEGGGSRDLLTGGAGADVFVYIAVTDSVIGNSRDLIQDFTRSQGDRIDLRGLDANTLLDGVQGFAFIGGAAFSAAGQLRVTGTLLSGDVDGDGIADFEIRVLGEPSLQAGDFLL
jgi:uncharacterized delta-60 repeat protein